MTGFPWQVGDALLAADLNAAIANAGALSETTIDVRIFGARGDGITDDTTAINAALDAVRASGTQPNQTVCLLFPSGRYVVTGPLNFTGIANHDTPVVIDGRGSQLWLKSTGAVVDCFSSRWVTFRDLAIYGDPTTPPRIGIQLGRIATQQGDFITFINVKCSGHFTFAALYNWASETFTGYACTFNNNRVAANAFCVVQDGNNHWAASSTFVTVGFPTESRQSNNSCTFHECTMQGQGTNGNVWMSNVNAHAFRRCYASNSTGPIFVLYQDAGSFAAAALLEIECHCETGAIQTMLRFTGAAGVTFALAIGLMLSDYDMPASISVLGIDGASALTTVEIREAKFTISGNCPALFDTPSKYVVRAHEALLSDGMWALPALWAGPVSNVTFAGTIHIPENTRIVAATGGATELFRNNAWANLVPAGTIAAYGIIMPTAARHGQTVVITTTQTITALTINPNTGQTVRGSQPNALTANTSVSYRYDGTTAAWFCLGRTAA